VRTSPDPPSSSRSSTDPSYNLCTQHLQHLHLALQVGHTVYTKPLLELSLFPFLTFPSYLFILYKIGLNMGKPMG
jgi:hypothetical protein